MLKRKCSDYPTTEYRPGKPCTVICGSCGTSLAYNEKMDIKPFDSKTIKKLSPIFYNAKFCNQEYKNLVVLPQIHTSQLVSQVSRYSGLWEPVVCPKCNTAYQNILIFKVLDINILVCL